MKKIALTIAIVLGLSFTTFADPQGGGFLKRGETPETVYGNRDVTTPMLPNHNESGNQNADAPLGTGIAVLTALGAAYLVGKRRREE